MKIVKKAKGFTLIELLVVISIIGILAALATISFTSTQKQARDTQRKSDLKQYQNALEMDANKYSGLYMVWTGKVRASTTLCASLSLSNCPEDPRYSTDNTYAYYYISDGTTNGTRTATQYVLWGKIENVSSVTYWVVCSTGQSGKTTTQPSSSTCPALTQ
jgi:type IV pilus assembly protein PilA